MNFSCFVALLGITLGGRLAHVVPSPYFYTFTSPQFVPFMNFLTIPHPVPALLYTSLRYNCLLFLNFHVIANPIIPNTIQDIAHSHILWNLWGVRRNTPKERHKATLSHSRWLTVLLTQVSLPPWLWRKPRQSEGSFDPWRRRQCLVASDPGLAATHSLVDRKLVAASCLRDLSSDQNEKCHRLLLSSKEGR